MKLIHAIYSSSSRRVTLTARLLGVRFEEEQQIDLRKPEDRAVLVQLNPNSKIPVLIDGDLILWESHAIMQYLCEGTPGQTLLPEERRARADVQRWLHWTGAHLSNAVGGLGWENIWKKSVTGQDPDPDQVKRHETFFHQFATVLDRHLAARTFVSGDALTLADLSPAATLMYSRPARLPIKPYANILAWLGRVQALDAWQATEPPPFGAQ